MLNKNFYFDKNKMTAFRTLSKDEFLKLYPSTTEQEIINTIRLQSMDMQRELRGINSEEHMTEIFSACY